jgi:ribonuclease E
MESPKNQRDVEDRLRDAVKMDRARIQIGRLSRFGLLEMSRQRLRPSLGESSHLVCPRCTGIGSIRSVESMTLAILRLIGEEARKDKTAQIIAQVPVEVATYLMNEKREWLRTLEDKSAVDLMIVPNPHIQTPEYSIKRVRTDEVELPENKVLSYKMPERPQVADPTGTRDVKPVLEPAAVIPTAPTTSAPVVVHVPVPAKETAVSVAAPPRGLGFWARLSYLFTGDVPANAVTASPAPSAREPRRDGPRDGNRDRDRSRPRHGSGERGRDRDRDRDRDRGAHGRDRHRDKDGRHRDKDAGRDRHREHGRSAGGEHGRDRDAAPPPREPVRDLPRDAQREQPPRERDPQRDAERQAQRERQRERQREQQAAANANAIPLATAAAADSAPAGVSDAAPGAEANGPAQDGGPRGDGRGRRGRRRGRRGGGRNREGGQQNNVGGESHEGGTPFAGAREASDEEREFHAQMSNGNRGPGRDSADHPRQEAPRESSADTPREPQRESRNEGTQAPLDLPPPPPTKPFVVWSSSPSDSPPPTERRDD